MPKRSAGVLLFRRGRNEIEVLLAHPGGPFWKNKDDGAWSIPKGEYGENEDPLAAAKREFAEETGLTSRGISFPWARFASPAAKWSQRGHWKETSTPPSCAATPFSMPWPPGSGKLQEFPGNRSRRMVPPGSRPPQNPKRASQTLGTFGPATTAIVTKRRDRGVTIEPPGPVL